MACDDDICTIIGLVFGVHKVGVSGQVILVFPVCKECSSSNSSSYTTAFFFAITVFSILHVWDDVIYEVAGRGEKVVRQKRSLGRKDH